VILNPRKGNSRTYRKAAKDRGRLSDALVIGILPSGVEFPISVENISGLDHGADGLVNEIDEKER